MLTAYLCGWRPPNVTALDVAALDVAARFATAPATVSARLVRTENCRDPDAYVLERRPPRSIAGAVSDLT